MKSRLDLPTFERSPQEISRLVDQLIENGKRTTAEIGSQNLSRSTFASTVGALDQMAWEEGQAMSRLHLLHNVSPDEKIRNAAQEAIVKFQNFAIERAYDQAVYVAIKSYFARRQASPSAFRAELSDINLLNDEACWNEFIADKERILKNSLELLNFYHDWWLLGIGKEKSEPLQRMEQTGIMDPIDNTTLAEWNKFDALYPAISFALSYIINHHNDAGIIQKIALTNLEDAPDMWGKDLWLQRRAMIACVQRDGLVFVTENLSQIRYELIYYVLLKTDTKPAELDRLKEAILTETEYQMQGMMESEHIIELMDRLVA